MQLYYRRLIWILYLLCVVLDGFAQNESDERALLRVEQGVSFSKDSVFLMNLRFRMQNRFGYLSVLDDTLTEGFDVRVRRLRLRLDGFAISPRLSYYIQLSFSAGDQDFIDGFAPNIVRDAMLYYAFTPGFYVGFGQSKLPGNRQRVISSGNLQMPERSYANQFYTLDRDVGLFLYKSFGLHKQEIQLKAALTGGEGRLAGLPNTALAYTARIEYLPFGAFANTGDYSEGDLEWEASPKLSVALGWSYNQRALRAGGQLGRPLSSPVDMVTWIADLMFKYRGWALMIEYFYREVYRYNPADVFNNTIYTGNAWNLQLSKVLRGFHEISLRYTRIDPPTPMRSYQAYWHTRAVGYSKYFNGHRIKAQTYVGLDDRSATLDRFGFRNRLSLLFQLEFGI